jgi:hypothetical protein
MRKIMRSQTGAVRRSANRSQLVAHPRSRRKPQQRSGRSSAKKKEDGRRKSGREGDCEGAEGSQGEEVVSSIPIERENAPAAEKNPFFWISRSENKVNQGPERTFHKVNQRVLGGKSGGNYKGVSAGP